MTKLTFLALVLSSMQVLACPELAKKYVCDERADTYLGNRNIELKYNADKQSFLFLIAETPIADYPVGRWLQMINQTTGDEVVGGETRADCVDNKLSLMVRMTLAGDPPTSATGALELTKLENGINLRYHAEGTEYYNFNCQ